jgi:hypothetical protein
MKTLEASFIMLTLALTLSAADQPTPLSALLDEATRSNPDILAARRGWQAATQVPSQVATPPDPLAARDRLQDSATAISHTLDSGSLKTCPIRES